MDWAGMGLLFMGLCSVLSPTFGQNFYQNVAPGKTYNQSSVYVSSTLGRSANPASYAANGNTDGTYNSTNCFQTAADDPNDWWEVDLGTAYPLYTFRIWGRTNSQNRLYPFNITVDGQTCASESSGTYRRVDVTCSSFMSGQVVRFARTSNAEMINMCEFEVLVCQDGWWGLECDKRCSIGCMSCHRGTGSSIACLPGFYRQFKYCPRCMWSCYQGTVCDPDSGDCAVCPLGRKGNRCGQDCDGNMYGQNCSTPCGDCANGQQCVVFNGQCPNGCEPGLQPPMCVTECSDGTYGPDCQETCGQCRDGAVCDKVTGHCPLCPPGLYQPLCNTECLDGTYGDNCTEECGACDGGVLCDKQTGYCPCPVGKQPPICKLDCQNKMYGADCAQSCGHCRDDQACDLVNGHCSDGCQPGWIDLDQSSAIQLCQTACPAGLYGERCNQTCGQCQGQAACSHDTGHCSQGCADGYTGRLCLQASDNQSGGVEKLIGPIIGSIVGVGLLMTISITAAICWRRRSRDGPDRTESAAAPPTGTPVELSDVDIVEPMSSPTPPPNPKEEQLYTTIADNDNYDKLHPYSNDNADRSPYTDLTSDSNDVTAAASYVAYMNTSNK